MPGSHGLPLFPAELSFRRAAEGAVVLMVSCVVAGCPFEGVTDKELKAQLTPLGSGVEQLNATALLKPPEGVTVKVKTAD